MKTLHLFLALLFAFAVAPFAWANGGLFFSTGGATVIQQPAFGGSFFVPSAVGFGGCGVGNAAIFAPSFGVSSFNGGFVGGNSFFLNSGFRGRNFASVGVGGFGGNTTFLQQGGRFGGRSTFFQQNGGGFGNNTTFIQNRGGLLGGRRSTFFNQSGPGGNTTFFRRGR